MPSSSLSSLNAATSYVEVNFVDERKIDVRVCVTTPKDPILIKKDSRWSNAVQTKLLNNKESMSDVCFPKEGQSSKDNSNMQEAMDKCPICGKNFLPSDEREVHVNKCLDTAGGSATVTSNNNQLKSDELLAQSLQKESFREPCIDEENYFCSFCGKDLSKWNSQRRQKHMNECADRVLEVEKSSRKLRTRNVQSKSDAKILLCPMCGKSFATWKFSKHLKICQKKNNTSASTLLVLLREAGISLSNNEESNLKRRKTNPVINVKSSASTLVKPDLQNDIIKERVNELVSNDEEQADVISTPTLKESSIGKYHSRFQWDKATTEESSPEKNDRNMLEQHIIQDTQCKLWNLSSFNGHTNAKDFFISSQHFNIHENKDKNIGTEITENMESTPEQRNLSQSFTSTQFEKLNILLSLNATLENQSNENGFITEGKMDEIQNHSTRKLLIDLANLLQSSLTSDFIFHCRDNVDIPCHKVILMARCDFFKQVIENGSNSYGVTDISSPAVDCFLKYIYTGIVDIKDCVDEAFKLSQRFNEELLSQACISIDPSLNKESEDKDLNPNADELVSTFWKKEDSFYINHNEVNNSLGDENKHSDELGDDSCFSDDELELMQEIFRTQVQANRSFTLDNNQPKKHTSSCEETQNSSMNSDVMLKCSGLKRASLEIIDTKETESLKSPSMVAEDWLNLQRDDPDKEETCLKEVSMENVDIDEITILEDTSVKIPHNSKHQHQSNETIIDLEDDNTSTDTVNYIQEGYNTNLTNNTFPYDYKDIHSTESQETIYDESCADTIPILDEISTEEENLGCFDTSKIKSTPELLKQTSPNLKKVSYKQYISPSSTPMPFTCETPALFNKTTPLHDQSIETSANEETLNGTEKSNDNIIVNMQFFEESVLNDTVVHKIDEDNDEFIDNITDKQIPHENAQSPTMVRVAPTYSQTVDFRSEISDCQIIEPKNVNSDESNIFGKSILASDYAESPCMIRQGVVFSSTPSVAPVNNKKKLLHTPIYSNIKKAKSPTKAFKSPNPKTNMLDGNPSSCTNFNQTENKHALSQKTDNDVILLDCSDEDRENKSPSKRKVTPSKGKVTYSSSSDNLSSSCESPRSNLSFTKQVKRKRKVLHKSLPSMKKHKKMECSSDDDNVSDQEGNLLTDKFHDFEVPLKSSSLFGTPSKKKTKRDGTNYSPVIGSTWLSKKDKTFPSTKTKTKKTSKKKQVKEAKENSKSNNDFKNLVKSLPGNSSSSVESVSSSDEW